MMVAIAQPASQELPINPRKCCSMKSMLFSPLRFCGQQWMWVRSKDNNQISQVALKILLVPFLACLTVLSGLPALLGALIFSADHIPEYTKYNPAGDLGLLRRDVSNEQIAEKVKAHLNSKGHNYTVNVRSMDREAVIGDNYYPEYIHRYITLTNPSCTSMTRFKVLLKNHFYNKDVSSLKALYPCIWGSGTEKGWSQLRDVLALHRTVTFSLPFDLTYIWVKLGEYKY